MTPIVIIGGGIAGLAAAWELARAGREFVLLEAGPQLGGVIATTNEDGFLLESGPDSFLSAKPAARRLCEELGLTSDLLPSQAGGRTTILHGGRLHPLPDGWQMLVPGKLGPALGTRLLSAGAKARIAARWFAAPPPHASDEETIGEFLRRHFGAVAAAELISTVAGPLLAGVYGGDVEQLELAAVLPRLSELGRNGNLIRALHAAPTTVPPGAPLFTTLRAGMGSLVAALQAALPPDAVRLRAPAVAVFDGEGGTGYRVRLDDGHELAAAAVIVATPAWAAAGLVQHLDVALAATLSQIPYVSSLVLNVGYDVTPDLPSGFGFLVPRAEGRHLFACTFVHRKFAGRVPPGAGLLRLFYTSEPLEWTAEQLEAVAREELRTILGITATPRFLRRGLARRAMAQYTRGHGRRLAAIGEALVRHPGLGLAGNAYRGIGLPDCIESGRAAARALQARAA